MKDKIQCMAEAIANDNPQAALLLRWAAALADNPDVPPPPFAEGEVVVCRGQTIILRRGHWGKNTNRWNYMVSYMQFVNPDGSIDYGGGGSTWDEGARKPEGAKERLVVAMLQARQDIERLKFQMKAAHRRLHDVRRGMDIAGISLEKSSIVGMRDKGK